MNCLPCFSKDDDEDDTPDQPTPNKRETPTQPDPTTAASSSNAQTFTFRELAMATKNFRQECLLGEGGFGRVFKGKLHSSGKVVAVKQLDRNGMQGNKEFLVEVMMLSLLQHPNLVSLIGYCADGDQRLLVYEFMPMGNLDDHLFGDDKKPMDWCTRMKIASGAAQGLEYLHEKANPAIIYRDLKPSNILLDENYEPKLSDYGLAKLGAGGGKINPTSRVMGTYGYSAPEYSSSGELTLKSDIYSFGVVLLELITGRRVIDTTKPNDEQNLVTWAQPIFREPKRFPEMADPRLNKEFPVTSLNQAVGIAAMCLQEEASVRPLIGDVVAALSFLSIPQPNSVPASIPAAEQKSPKDGGASAFTPPPEQKMNYENEVDHQKQQPTTQPDNNKHCSNHDDDDDGSSAESEDEESDRGSTSEQPNGGSSHNHSERESGPHSESESGDGDGDYSEDESTYSDADSADINENEGEDEGNNNIESKDGGTVGDANVNRLNSGHSNSRKSEVGNLSSHHGSSRRSSSSKRTGSRRRKMVVTFKEPNLSKRRNGSKKVEEEQEKEKEKEEESSSQVNTKVQATPVQPTAATTTTDQVRQQQNSSSSSSSSSDSSSSSSEDEKKSKKHKKAAKESKREKNGKKRRGKRGSIDGVANHREEPDKGGPKLRHLQTR